MKKSINQKHYATNRCLLLYMSLLIDNFDCRAVTESINNLITHCTESSPGQKECDNALRQIEVSY